MLYYQDKVSGGAASDDGESLKRGPPKSVMDMKTGDSCSEVQVDELPVSPRPPERLLGTLRLIHEDP